METKARFADIKRFAVHDGPGIRTTLFLKGCPLSCVWCHNPETIDPRPQLLFHAARCINCGECAAVCRLHKIVDGVHVFDRNGCVNCGKCAGACFCGALELCGREITVGEAAEILFEDIHFYEHSGGGITLSGGEPLLQHEFVKELFTLMKRKDIHCALDTSGCVPWKTIKYVVPVTDLFLYDLKAMSTELHQKLTGCGNELILDNLKSLDDCGATMEIRMLMVPGINNGDDSLRAAAEFLGKLKNPVTVRLLAYHRLASAKYAAAGRSDHMPDVPLPDSKFIAAAAEKLRDFGLKYKIKM